MAMFKISSMKSPMIFADERNHHHNHHRVSVMVNGSVVSEEEHRLNNLNAGVVGGVNSDSNRVVVNNNGNKGRVLIKSSEERSVAVSETSKIYLEGEPAATESARSARSSGTAPGTTSIRVSEVINREKNQDRVEKKSSIRDSDSVLEEPASASPARVISASLASSQSQTRVVSVKPGLPLKEEEFEKNPRDKEATSSSPRTNRFPLVHQSRFNEETDRPRIVGGSSKIASSTTNIVSVRARDYSSLVRMVPGTPNLEQPQKQGLDNGGTETDNEHVHESYDLEARGDKVLIESNQISPDVSVNVAGPLLKLSQYVSLGGGSSVATQEEWLKNEVNLVPKFEDTIIEDNITVETALDGVNDLHPHSIEDMNIIRVTNVAEESDVLAEGIKLRVSFGNNHHSEEMVSRSPDDGYHDDDTMSEEESSPGGHPVVINETVPSANDGIHVAIPVRLTPSLDSSTTNYDREMKFMKMNHVKHDSDVFEDDANSSLSSETGTILSRRGTIRGMKNHVRSSIAAFLENMASKRQYGKEENGRVVLYTTSMGVVRRTHDLCRRARNIMYTLMIRFEERDVFMNRLYQTEVCERLHLDEVIVPQLFVDGILIGNADVIERLNETGELRKLLEPYKRQSVGTVCQMCGDFRFLPCTTCGGSKKSLQHRHQFSEEIVALRCMVCDENGLIRCNICLNDDQS